MRHIRQTYCDSIVFFFAILLNILSFISNLSAAPFWLEKPTNLVMAPEENGRMVCRSDGAPRPTVTWLVNGEPIESKLDHRNNICANINTYLCCQYCAVYIPFLCVCVFQMRLHSLIERCQVKRWASTLSRLTTLLFTSATPQTPTVTYWQMLSSVCYVSDITLIRIFQVHWECTLKCIIFLYVVKIEPFPQSESWQTIQCFYKFV